MNLRSSPLLFRFDAGPVVGLGHWYRCVALAEALGQRGVAPVHFLVNEIGRPLERELQQRGIPFTTSARWGDPDAVLEAAQSFPNAKLVLDTMETTVEFVEAVQRRLPVLSIGGSGLGRDRVQVRIDGMVPRPGYAASFTGERLFAGPEYVILRHFFDDVSSSYTRPSLGSVLVALGGDAAGIGLAVARVVRAISPDLHVNVLMGPLAAEATFLDPGIRLHRGVENPRPLMETCDVAIVSGGMSAYELMRVGRPLLLLPQTELQETASRAFVEAGVGLLVTRAEQSEERRLQSSLAACLDQLREPAIRARMADVGRSLIDGHGLQRVAEIIQNWSQERA